MQSQTLPNWTRGWPWSLDVIRKVIRQRAELQKLGVRVGASKVYSEQEAETIRRAVEERSLTLCR